MGNFLLPQFLSLSNNPDTAGEGKIHPFYVKFAQYNGTYRQFLARLEKVVVQTLNRPFFLPGVPLERGLVTVTFKQ
jgi:hypothetical protein